MEQKQKINYITEWLREHEEHEEHVNIVYIFIKSLSGEKGGVALRM